MKKTITNKIFYFFAALSLSLTFSACLKNQVSITEADKTSADQVHSYADLFQIFWDTMDQRYNYLYEQERKDGMSWDDIYKIYYPKFQALKTFVNDSTFSDQQIIADGDSARSYFTNIINPIIDRHFFVDIYLPVTRNTFDTRRYRGGMKGNETNVMKFEDKLASIENKLNNDYYSHSSNLTLSQLFSGAPSITFAAGTVTSNPDVFYMAFDGFFLTRDYKINVNAPYLRPQSNNQYILTVAEIENSDSLKSIKDDALREKVKNATLAMLNQYNAFFNSKMVDDFNTEVAKFDQTEMISDLLYESAKAGLSQYINLPDYGDDTVYPAEVINSDTESYMTWFKNRINEHVLAYEAAELYVPICRKILNVGEFYTKILNPLHEGKYKKIILDLRGNGGGSIVDGRFFTDRFITKPTTFAFQRTRVGNNRYDYSPWIPVQTKKHKFGIPTNIPIAILTDKGSASMSELSTLMIKSQGNQIFTVGDYSAGATAGLGPAEIYNGGIQGDVAGGYLTFYMPIMATKDSGGEVVEGKGIKPTYYVAPPTDEEMKQLSESPSTFNDRVFNEALKALSSM